MNAEPISTTRPGRSVRSLVAAAAVTPLILLAGCGGQSTTPGASETTSSSSTSSSPTETPATEVAAASPRLALAQEDGTVVILDATTLEVLGEQEYDGFTRVNPAGDGRHVFVSTTGGFELFDTGTWAEPHGDHNHYWTATPHSTGEIFPAETPGHVVIHAGRTVLFDDGTGNVASFDSTELADRDREAREYTTPAPHHGVAVELSNGELVVSEGTEDGRTGVRVLDADNTEIAANDDCPGVHGETVAADEAVVIGCQTGVVVYRDGQITKIPSPDAYGRIGNQAGHEDSPFVLGDYKVDPDADLERPTRVSIVDTVAGTLRLVDLPSSYTFRSLGRGDDGEALVLGTDGSLHVIDPETATVVRSIPVVQAWEEPDDWQEPRPALFVADGTAYVTDPANDAVHAVDVETGEIWASAELPGTPNEITGASGDA